MPQLLESLTIPIVFLSKVDHNVSEKTLLSFSMGFKNYLTEAHFYKLQHKTRKKKKTGKKGKRRTCYASTTNID